MPTGLAGSEIPTKSVAHAPVLREKAPAQFKKDPNRLSQNELLALPGCGHRGILPCFNRNLLGRLVHRLLCRCLNPHLVHPGRQRGSVRVAALQLADTLSVKVNIENQLFTERCGPHNGQLASVRRGCRTRNENASKRGYDNGENEF
jgi:hypothetical protein